MLPDAVKQLLELAGRQVGGLEALDVAAPEYCLEVGDLLVLADRPAEPAKGQPVVIHNVENGLTSVRPYDPATMAWVSTESLEEAGRALQVLGTISRVYRLQDLSRPSLGLAEL